MLGVIPIFFHTRKEKIIPVSLAFSAGLLLCISLLSFIPEAASYMQAEWKQIYAMIFSLQLYAFFYYTADCRQKGAFVRQRRWGLLYDE